MGINAKIYIDGANVFYTQKRLGWSVDLAKKLKDAGRKVTVYSSRKTISWELKLAASKVVYLEDIFDIIARKI